VQPEELHIIQIINNAGLNIYITFNYLETIEMNRQPKSILYNHLWIM